MKCPICDTPTQREGNPNRPFCSERCRMIDFGNWVDENYSVPVSQPDSVREQPASNERERDETSHDY